MYVFTIICKQIYMEDGNDHVHARVCNKTGWKSKIKEKTNRLKQFIHNWLENGVYKYVVFNTALYGYLGIFMRFHI